jgi:hypothetical protein
VPVITIVGNSYNSKRSGNKREVVVISSRVHPGESNASFVFEGFFNFITNVGYDVYST